MGAERAHVAVLLAAGASTRLGMPKQLLTRGGVPLVRLAAERLASTWPCELLVVLGAHAADIRAALEGLPYRAVVNPDIARGLSGSLRCAANALRDAQASVLIAVCDQPALQARHLEALIIAARAAPAKCAATEHGDRLGIPALVSRAVFQHSHALQGDRGLGHVLSQIEGVARLEAPELAFDIDTPEQLSAARTAGLID